MSMDSKKRLTTLLRSNRALLRGADIATTQLLRLATALTDGGAAVPIRCRDCGHLLKDKMLCLHPGNRVFHTGIKVTADHYCSYGERKTDAK